MSCSTRDASPQDFSIMTLVEAKDLFIKNRSRTVVKLLLFCFDFLWISLWDKKRGWNFSQWVMSGVPRVTNGEFYPSFLLILASITFLIGKWKLAEKNFPKIMRKFADYGSFSFPIVLNKQNYGKKKMNHTFSLIKILGKRKWTMICENEP